MESFGRLGEEGYEFVDDLATHAAVGRDGRSLALKFVFKKRLLQVIPVATQVAISRRVQRYKLELRGRQEAEAVCTIDHHSVTRTRWWCGGHVDFR